MNQTLRSNSSPTQSYSTHKFPAKGGGSENLRHKKVRKLMKQSVPSFGSQGDDRADTPKNPSANPRNMFRQ